LTPESSGQFIEYASIPDSDDNPDHYFEFVLFCWKCREWIKGGEKLASSIFSGGADGWAAAGMLRSPVAGIHAAGAVYGVLTLIVLIMNVTDSVQGMMESEGELPARGQFRAPGIGSKLPIRQ